jgi:hypothetical protein
MAQDKAQSLFLAILALDSYNRGYLPGYTEVFERNGTAIGDATIKAASDPDREDVAFFAQSYVWSIDNVVNKVISYRGTTFEIGINTGRDVLYGWTLSGGWANAPQPRLAKAFYEQITQQNVYGTTPPANVILTGHSLGGGLAGFVGVLTGADTSIYNNIGFGAGAVVDSVVSGNFPSGLPTTSSHINQFLIAGEVALLARRGGSLLASLTLGALLPIPVALAAVAAGAEI